MKTPARPSGHSVPKSLPRTARPRARYTASARSAETRLIWLGPADMVSRLPIEGFLTTISGGQGRASLDTIDLAELATRLAACPAPDAVLSPLFWRGGDVMEAARLMQRHRWPGPYRVISPPLPRPGMVETEIRAACPDLDFALIPLPRR